MHTGIRALGEEAKSTEGHHDIERQKCGVIALLHEVCQLHLSARLELLPVKRKFLTRSCNRHQSTSRVTQHA
jgi:hypothetical protein